MKSAPLSEHICAELRDEILRGRFRSGERLPSERDLAQSFDVHRGAVREALKTLEQLGLATIQAGGARVNPVEEASLDVVEHLLALSDPPDPKLVGEVFEAVSGLMGLAVRLCVERGSDEQQAQVLQLLGELARKDLSDAEEFALFEQFSKVITRASGNTVIMLVRRGLKTQFLGKLRDRERLMASPSENRIPIVKRLAQAFEERDGPAATEAAYQLGVGIRSAVVKSLEAQTPSPDGTGSDGSTR